MSYELFCWCESCIFIGVSQIQQISYVALDWFAAEPHGGRGLKQASAPFPQRFNKAP